MKIVFNNCFGGFGLSNLACKRMVELGYEGMTLYRDKEKIPLVVGQKILNAFPWKTGWWIGYRDIPRDNLILIQVVEELGKEANNQFSKLEIAEIPDDVKWHIHEYDGLEHVAENHRTWS